MNILSVGLSVRLQKSKMQKHEMRFSYNFKQLRYLWMLSSLFINIFVKSMQSQGTVDNNLGPDRLAGPKALDPNNCRQPTL